MSEMPKGPHRELHRTYGNLSVKNTVQLAQVTMEGTIVSNNHNQHKLTEKAKPGCPMKSRPQDTVQRAITP